MTCRLQRSARRRRGGPWPAGAEFARRPSSLACRKQAPPVLAPGCAMTHFRVCREEADGRIHGPPQGVVAEFARACERRIVGKRERREQVRAPVGEAIWRDDCCGFHQAARRFGGDPHFDATTRGSRATASVAYSDFPDNHVFARVSTPRWNLAPVANMRFAVGGSMPFCGGLPPITGEGPVAETGRGRGVGHPTCTAIHSAGCGGQNQVLSEGHR